MHETAASWDDTSLRALFGAATFVRGSSYAREGRVLHFSVHGDRIVGVVAGSEGRQYRTTVTLEHDVLDGRFDSGLDAWCTCPVGIDCKHAAALLIAARSELARTTGAGVRPQAQWEQVLGSLRAEPTPDLDAVPLGLQLDVMRRPSRPSPYLLGTQPVPERRIRLRPVVPGVRGGWIRTGISWRDLRLPAGYSSRDPEHHRVLHEMLLTYEASSTMPYGSYGGDVMFLDEFGPSLWRVLEQVVAAGVELVLTGKRPPPVTVADDPARVSILVVDGGAQAGASLLPQVLLDGQSVASGSADLLGSPPHGVAVHGDHGVVLARLDRPVDPALEELVRNGAPVRIPADDLDRFVTDYYPRLHRIVDIAGADGAVALPEIVPPRLALTLTYRDGHRVVLEWAFEYGATEKPQVFPVRAAEGGPEPDAERALLSEVRFPECSAPYLRPDVAGSHRRLLSPLILSGMDAVAFLDQALPALREQPRVVVHERGERPEFREASSPPQVEVRAADTDEADWFDLHVAVVVDGEEVPFEPLFRALARGESHLLLPSGLWFDLDRPELHQLRRLIDEARALLEAEEGHPLRVSRYQAGFWEELCEIGVVAEQSARWEEAVAGLVDAAGDLDVDPGCDTDAGEIGEVAPAGLRAELRPYQLEGYRWLSFLWDHRLGGVLADDMGLGKTVQTLALLCRAKAGGHLQAPVVVVAPTSVVRNWVAEAGRFAPGLRVVAIGETAARRGTPVADAVAGADVVVTSYSLFRLEFDAYAALSWSGLVLDEAQFVKNHQAKTYQCVRRLDAPFKLAITGTPLENNLGELWALLSIVAPGLFPTLERFAEVYRKPIEQGSDPDRLTALRRRVRPLMRRRTKEQVAADLPQKQEQVLEVELGPRHRRIYDTHLHRERQKILGLLEDFDKHRFTILKSLTRLRQLSLDPALVDDAHAGVGSAKLDVLLEHLVELAAEGHRALVFSQFTGFLSRVKERLDAAGIAYCYLDGGTRNRDRVIAAFKNGDAPVFLISLKAGGFGLNLTEADYCFILDPWWNPATEAQAVDRTHRIGQDKRVVVYRLVSTDTIEEKVMALKARKAELFGSVMSDDGTLSGPLSAADVRGLLDR